MKLRDALEMAYICGLHTALEAVRNVDHHSGSLFAHIDTLDELTELYCEYEALPPGRDTLLVVDLLGAEACARLDAVIDAANTVPGPLDIDESLR